MSAHVWGVGTSSFGRRPERLPADLGWEAVSEALVDAGVDAVDAAFVGTVFGSPGDAQRVLLGLRDDRGPDRHRRECLRQRHHRLPRRRRASRRAATSGSSPSAWRR